MDHQSINDTMNDAIIFRQDIAWMRWIRQQIFDPQNKGATRIQLPERWIEDDARVTTGFYPNRWPHDDTADLLTAWQPETTTS